MKLYFNNMELLLNYVNNTIQAQKKQKIPVEMAKINLLSFLEFIKNIRPSYCDKTTMDIMHDLMVKIKITLDNESLEKFSGVHSIIDSDINSINNGVRYFESIDD